MKFQQPQLPYSPYALEPVISATTIEYHYGKHEKAYIDNLNRIIKDTDYEEMPLERI
ncbi:MAG: superoxide dismutase, partial [Muribaculaceae bacterium]|nr:superoxide dismutase [Muribaculaceae bacterium]